MNSFELEGTSGGGGGGGGAKGSPGKAGESAPWRRERIDTVPGREYVVVIGAGGCGGRSAAPDEDQGEDGGAGGISFMSDGADFCFLLGATGSSVRLSDELKPPSDARVDLRVPTRRYAIVDASTRVVDNVIVANGEFFEHPLTKRVVLESQIVGHDGHFALQRRSKASVFVALDRTERAATGWLFLGDLSSILDVNSSTEQARFIQAAWPRRPKSALGAAGGSGGVRRPDPNLSGRLRMLCVATEWSSAHGGLSTVNRELCTALAALEIEVVCLVPPGAIDERARADAHRARVELVEAPTTSGKDVGTLACLHRKPQLPGGFSPDVIIGHGRITGFAAQTLAQDHFNSVHVHVVHTQPGEIEWYKARAAGAAVRVEFGETEERILARSASLVVGVGPRLRRQAEMYLHSESVKPPTIELDPGMLTDGSARSPAPEMECLFIGRAEDECLKGLDIAAGAVRYARSQGNNVRLVVRGSDASTSSELQGRLSELIGAPNSVKVYDFSPDQDAIRTNFLRASVVLMPSRSEGFGLVGLEAIALGIPVLISDQSGLAELLIREFPEFAPSIVVPLGQNDQANYQTWGDRISLILNDRVAAFARAAEIQLALSKRFTWAAAADALIQSIRSLSRKTPV